MNRLSIAPGDNRQRAKVELSTRLLEKLIKSGLISANEFKCLDDTAKKVVCQSVLANSASKEHSLC